jgi:methylated-DNA-[protein]-cysteine S-methyltransferase
MIYTYFDSPLGNIRIVSDGEKITTFGFVGQKNLKDVPTDWKNEPDHKLLKKARKQAEEYFSGKRKDFDLPLSPQGTEFQQKVWKALLEIPFGQISTYGKIANQIGNPKGVRAVGGAIGRNPIGIIIPCHRVIGANGTLTGFASGLDRKQSLLEIEGVLL